jgi:hypothetical protein
MAKRRPVDDQWERTTGGVIVPRRGVSLPTRRWIGWMGGAQDCCEGSACTVCSQLDGEYDITLSGLADVTACRDSGAFAYWLWEVTTTGISACNRTWRVSFTTQTSEQNHASGCGKFGGCTWESDFLSNVFYLYVKQYNDEVTYDEYIGAKVILYVTTGMDVMVVLYFAPNVNVIYTIADLTCSAGVLNGQVLPYCGSWYPDCDFGSGGSATIAAV